MRNKLTFCSYPDTVMGTPCYGLKNYTNETIKQLLTEVKTEILINLIDQDNPNQWLQKVMKQATIIFDTDEVPLTQINKICQKQ